MSQGTNIQGKLSRVSNQGLRASFYKQLNTHGMELVPVRTTDYRVDTGH